MPGELPSAGLAWAAATQEGRAWLARLPELVRGCADRWQLTLGHPFDGAQASLAMPATRADGAPVVVKVQFPHRECEHEAAALRRWNGRGAVRLLDHDPERWALLLERCEPGTRLREADPEQALDVLAGLLPRLWVDADAPFTRLEDEAAWWASTIETDWKAAGRPIARPLVDAALEAIGDLSATQPERVLLHQDLHGDNVLAATREVWLAIDPKPLAGERAFGLAPIVRSHELGHSREAAVRRLDVLSDRLGVDRERARRWTIAQTVAWSLDPGAEPHHRETLAWLLEA